MTTKKQDKTRQISLRIPEELWKKLMNEAVVQHRSLNKQIFHILDVHFEMQIPAVRQNKEQ